MNENESLRAELALARDTIALLEGDLAILEAVNSANVNALADAVVQCDDLLAECVDRESERGDLRDRVQKAEPEVESLRRWKAEATEVILGLQDVGKALGLRLGERITGTSAAEAAKRLTERANKAEAALARVEALAIHAPSVPVSAGGGNLVRYERMVRVTDMLAALEDPS